MDTRRNLTGLETDHYRCPPPSLSLESRRECVLGNYMFLGALREKERSRLLGFSFMLPVLFQFLSFSGVHIQAAEL